jgi:TPR repeat protein
MPRITLAIATVLSFMAFTPVAAQDYLKGYANYQAGDYATAVQEWKPLAEAGNAASQISLGYIYENGVGVLQDYAEAVRWYRLAADQGIDIAQHNLGSIYYKGEGVLQDYAEALRWSRLAADQGNVNAQSNLGYMYRKGAGVLQDNVMAHMWYNIASANGYAKAGKYRDERAGLMTPADISKAQAMARECMSSSYKKCGY